MLYSKDQLEEIATTTNNKATFKRYKKNGGELKVALKVYLGNKYFGSMGNTGMCYVHGRAPSEGPSNIEQDEFLGLLADAK